MSTTATIERTIRNAGYGQFAGYADGAARALPTDRSVTPSDVQEAARRIAGRTAPDHLARQIAEAVNADREATTTEVSTEGFDRDACASRLREFAADRGAPMDEVDALLVEVGLVDPEPEPEPEDDHTLLQRLVAFARRHGFSG
jgi:hypothetical protein